MPTEINLQVPELLYQRLVNTAHATKRPLEEVVIHALQMGSPPSWDDIPEEFQAEIAALDKLDDNTLMEIVRARKTAIEMERYDTLLENNSNDTLTETERLELMTLRQNAELFTAVID